MSDELKPEGLSDENWTRLKDKIVWPLITTVDGGLKLTSWAQLDGIINICVADAARAQCPSTSGADEREEIARIIDHEGFWERLDRCNHALATVAMTDDQRRDLTAVRDDELRGTTDSLAKADAILARAQGPGPGEAVASISTDGPHEISSHRRWLARQFLDSQLSDAEAFGIVANSPAMIAATPTREV